MGFFVFSVLRVYIGLSVLGSGFRRVGISSSGFGEVFRPSVVVNRR